MNFESWAIIRDFMLMRIEAAESNGDSEFSRVLLRMYFEMRARFEIDERGWI